MEFTTTLSGVEELNKILALLPLEMDQKIIRDASRATMEPVLADAKAKCPVYEGPPRADVTPGALRDSLKISVRKRNAGELVTSVVTGEGDFKGDQYYGSFIEFGHRLGKRPGKGTGQDTRGEVVPHPFIRPAWDKHKDTAEQRFGEAVRAGIESVTGGRSIA